MDRKTYEAQEEQRLAIAYRHLEAGVTFTDIRTVYIDPEVCIGAGTHIGPCVTLEGKTVIGEHCMIRQNTRISASTIGDGVEIESSVILDSTVEDSTHVGPFAYLRPGTQVGKDCKVGDFVELKNASLGDGTKVSHLTYIGDADVGSKVNLGCGVVFVNYDGTAKHRSTVGDGAFIGCNVNLVSPVEIGDGAYIGAGSTVTRDVPKDALCVARAKQQNIEGWAERRGLYRKK